MSHHVVDCCVVTRLWGDCQYCARFEEGKTHREPCCELVLNTVPRVSASETTRRLTTGDIELVCLFSQFWRL